MPTQTYIRAFVYKAVLIAEAWRYVPGFIWKYSVSSSGQLFPDLIPSFWIAIAIASSTVLGLFSLVTALRVDLQVPAAVQMSCNPNNSSTAKVSAKITNALNVNNKHDSSKWKRPVRNETRPPQISRCEVKSSSHISFIMVESRTSNRSGR